MLKLWSKCSTTTRKAHSPSHFKTWYSFLPDFYDSFRATFHLQITDDPHKSLDDYFDVDQRVCDIAEAFRHQRIFSEPHGDKAYTKWIALFGAPGTSKSTTLVIAARLFEFWKHRTSILHKEQAELQACLQVFVVMICFWLLLDWVLIIGKWSATYCKLRHGCLSQCRQITSWSNRWPVLPIRLGFQWQQELYMGWRTPKSVPSCTKEGTGTVRHSRQ